MIVIKNGRTFSVEREILDVTPATINDLRWRHVDSHGHIHVWYDGAAPAEGRFKPDRKYHAPSTRTRIEGHYWCEDCGEEHALTKVVCVLCAEEVMLGHTSNDERFFIAGLATYRVDGNIVRKEEFLEALNA